MLSRLSSLEAGELEIRDRNGQRRLGRQTDGQLRAGVRVLDPRFYPYVALRGSVGAAESYMLGYWVRGRIEDDLREQPESSDES